LTALTAAAILLVMAAYRAAHGTEPAAASASFTGAETLLVGRFDNSAQVAEGQAAAKQPPVQHVLITIEPTPRKDWELWRVHMDVEPDLARAAGSDTSLDAVWAMKISTSNHGKSIELLPHTVGPSVDESTVSANAFDPSQWLSLEACMLIGKLSPPRIEAQVPANEMCVAAAMGLGGKRAFLPSSVEREGDWLHAQLMFFGRPWRVDAHRIN
jgi:hypothetical protein